uniref:Reverse transcriptase domain-containing protein n=1 Tax=Tanacetum cinerariifolium TaxID=118510 RepID=A0A699J6Z8_TANCI|nr:reverse transcriptase domain-containing protein [Tanacetum cinerariifolium]
MKVMMTEEFCPPEEIQRMEGELWNLRVKEMDISSYTTRFNELVILCPGMVPTEQKKVEAYIRGLLENIKGEVTLSEPATLNKVVRMAHTLMEQKVKAIAEREADNKKRKWENFRGGKRNGARGQAYALRDGDQNLEPNVVTVNHLFEIDLMPIELCTFDVIIGMNWLILHDAVIVCGKKEVHMPLKKRTLVVKGDDWVSRLKIVSCMRVKKYVDRGSNLFVAQVVEKEPTERRLEDVPVIYKFPDVFPEDLPGLPPPRQVEFEIELVPGAAPVTRAPYRLAPSEMKELAKQLQELSDKGFIHSILRFSS